MAQREFAETHRVLRRDAEEAEGIRRDAERGYCAETQRKQREFAETQRKQSYNPFTILFIPSTTLALLKLISNPSLRFVIFK